MFPPGQDDLDKMPYSYQYWTFINALAKRLQKDLPGKYILAMPYSMVSLPPSAVGLGDDFKLPSNVIVFSNIVIGRYPPTSEKVQPRLDMWMHLSGHYGNHDWMQGSGYLIPRNYTDSYAWFMKYLKAHPEVDGAYQDAEVYPNWGLDGPKLYIAAKLWWNPDIDVDAIWKQFCNDMFGPASAPMYDYFMKQEDLWNALQKEHLRLMFKWADQFQTTDASRAIMHEMRADLDKAASLAATDEQKQRVQLFSKTFHLSELLFNLAAEKEVKQSQLDDIKKYFADNIANDPMTLYSDMRDPKFFSGTVLRVVTRGKKIEP
jgi:hypothetical protein